MPLGDFQTTVRSKVPATRNLHELLPRDMDFFILLSSISGIIGKRGQSNYAVGNTYQDAMARYRMAQGLPTISVDLGQILSVGFMAENIESTSTLRKDGLGNVMQESEWLALLDILCEPAKGSAPTSWPAQVALGMDNPNKMLRSGMELPTWMHEPMYKQLHNIRFGEGDSNSSADGSGNVACSALLSTATSLDEATEIVATAIVRKLCKALSTSERDIDTGKPLHDFGVDSLVAVELRSWFMKDIGSDVAVFDIMGNLSIHELGELAAKRSQFLGPEAKGEGE
jgi:hypothetical protein